MANSKTWIKDAVNPAKKGALRRKLGVEQGENIPAQKLQKAMKSPSVSTRKQAALANTLKKLKK